MAFKGIYPAPELSSLNYSYGIFSVADVVKHTARAHDERWIRGFSQEFDTRPTVRLLDSTGTEAYEVFDGSRLARYYDIDPFFIEVEDFRSAFDVPGEDRFRRVLSQIDAASQKAVELELWNGYSTRANASANPYLTKPGSATFATIMPATAETPAEALALLESALSQSAIGEQGFLHFPRGFAVHEALQSALVRVDKDGDELPHIETVNGTPISLGSGNVGDGPFFVVSGAQVTGNVATLTTSTPHYLGDGDPIRVVGMDDHTVFNGEFTVVDAPTPTSVTYALTTSNTGALTTNGLVQMRATPTVKWAYATGHTYIHLGKSELVNDSLAQGFDVSGSQNDMRIKALRPATVYFDPVLHYAVKVRLTAS